MALFVPNLEFVIVLHLHYNPVRQFVVRSLYLNQSINTFEIIDVSSGFNPIKDLISSAPISASPVAVLSLVQL